MERVRRWIFEGLAHAFLARFGKRLAARYCNVTVAKWIAQYACFFNVKGAAVIWPEAPWFFTYDPGEQEDCALHPFNDNPVQFYRNHGVVFWWERPVQALRWLAALLRTARTRLCPKSPVPVPVLPTVELDPGRCPED